MRQLRLFHFDLRTAGNYGDTLLFEAVRAAFQSWSGGAGFDVYDSTSLRDAVGRGTVDYINATADAVVVGGGGLFLSDTNPNARSGWQWNISLELLRRIDKPLIIFAVGNNRFIGQPDFEAPFHDHLARTVEQSVFFGLRNHGSMRTIAEYLPASLRDRVRYQPCPTTVTADLYPSRVVPQPDERIIGVQQVIGKRQTRAGFDADEIGRRSVAMLKALHGDGWRIDSVPFARADVAFGDRLAGAGLSSRDVPLFGGRDVLFRGVDELTRIPVFFGTRGHAQMIPFGLGALPFSAMVHDKLRYFAEDLDRPDWVVDPRTDDFAETLRNVINTAWENRDAERSRLAARRAELLAITTDNLTDIHAALTGDRVSPEPMSAYSEREIRAADKLFVPGLRRDEAAAKASEHLDRADTRVRVAEEALAADRGPQPGLTRAAKRVLAKIRS